MNPEADVVPASIPMVAFSFRAEQMRSLEYLMSVPISLPRFWAAVVRRVPRGTDAAVVLMAFSRSRDTGRGANGLLCS